MSSLSSNQDRETFRDHIATIEADGSRKWIYPKKPKGRFYQWRTYVSWVLLALLFTGPFIKINGEPLLLFDVFDRKFVIFGQIFWPQDFYLFVFAMLTLVVFIILFTVVFGRIFCGWICPQTIFMEMVFRKIEYLIEGDWVKQKKLDKMPWNREKILKKGGKNLIFILISIIIAHTFLAYLIGVDQLNVLLTSNPWEHKGGFIAMVIFTGLFYGVFSRFREQACIIVCPYGRLQGVLLDNKSIVVAYDWVRGEPRNKFRKGEDREKAGKGDCIDCHNCVDVCPTGIDIRNGTQLECVNCTACIDACDHVMQSIGKPKGLIRYASVDNIKKGEPFKFTGRMVAYTIVLGILATVFILLLTLRAPTHTTILRSQGTMFQKLEDGKIRNVYTYKILNKTGKEIKATFRVENENAKIELVGNPPIVPVGGTAEGVMFIIMNPEDIDGYKQRLKIDVLNDEGKPLETVKTTFIGPM